MGALCYDTVHAPCQCCAPASLRLWKQLLCKTNTASSADCKAEVSSKALETKKPPLASTLLAPSQADVEVKKPAKARSSMFASDPRKTGLTQLREPVLAPWMASEIRESMPGIYRFKNWHLAYSTAVHGVSLQTLYRQQTDAVVLVIRDIEGSIFGAFSNEAWRPSRSGSGNGCLGTFAFRVSPDPDDRSVEVFPGVGSGIGPW